jgi:predicted DNA-binding protein (MmcQ/YjbR family)
MGHRGWIGVRLDRDVDWDEITSIVIEAYRFTAPKTLVRQLEDS